MLYYAMGGENMRGDGKTPFELLRAPENFGGLPYLSTQPQNYIWKGSNSRGHLYCISGDLSGARLHRVSEMAKSNGIGHPLNPLLTDAMKRDLQKVIASQAFNDD